MFFDYIAKIELSNGFCFYAPIIKIDINSITIRVTCPQYYVDQIISHANILHIYTSLSLFTQEVSLSLNER